MSIESGLIAICRARAGLEERTRAALLPTVPWALGKPGYVKNVLHVRKETSDGAGTSRFTQGDRLKSFLPQGGLRLWRGRHNQI